MRTIRDNGTHFSISFDFNPRIVKAVKAMPGHRWNPVNKSWSVPSSCSAAIEAFANAYHFDLNKPTVNFKEESHYDITPMPELTQSVSLKRELYPFQRNGVAYLLDKKRVLVGDQMGLGKTIQVIAATHAADAYPCLVICPASLKINWQREWESWTDRRAAILSDSTKDSFMNLYTFGLNQVFITNYESLKKYFVHEIKPSKKLTLKDIVFKQVIRQFKSVIIDESHRTKDSKTLQSKLTKGICDGKEYVFALSGTPLVNRPADLIPQLSIINRLADFGGYKNFVEVFCDGGAGSSNLRYLNFMLRQNCFFRRDKSEVLTQLPAKVRQVVYCEIDAKARREYSEVEADMVKYLKDYKNATDEKIRRAMRGEVMVKIGIMKNIAARGKMDDVFEFIDDVMADGEKLVVFGHLKEILGAVKSRYEGCLSITGDDSIEDRQAAIDRFQNDPDSKLIACSIKAAGVGITLTAASRVAFIEQWWTAADHEQCEDRCHRIGQQDSVQCTYFLGKDTIDEKIYDIWTSKALVANTATGAKNDIETSFVDRIVGLFKI